jgi:hypothetical protein
MTIDRVDRTVVTQEPTGLPGQQSVRTDSRRITRSGPGASEMTRRIIVLVFGLIQIVIGARIVLVLINAKAGNDLVAGIMNISQLFVGPFQGILRTPGDSVLDVAAVLAIVSWTILELIVIWAVGIFRREPA